MMQRMADLQYERSRKFIKKFDFREKSLSLYRKSLVEARRRNELPSPTRTQPQDERPQNFIEVGFPQEEEVESVDERPPKEELPKNLEANSRSRKFIKKFDFREKRKRMEALRRNELPSPTRTQPPQDERPQNFIEVGFSQEEEVESVDELSGKVESVEWSADERIKYYEDKNLFVKWQLEKLYCLMPTEDLLINLHSKRYRLMVSDIVSEMMDPEYECMKESDFKKDTKTTNGDILMMWQEMRRLALWQKTLIKHEKEYGVEAWYDSISYPLTPSSIRDLNSWHDRIGEPKNELEIRLDEVQLLQYFQVRESKHGSVKKSLDVQSLLSLGGGTYLVGKTETGGERRIALNSHTFRDKNVFVFFIDVPVIYKEDFQYLLNLCKELSLERADDCEMVMVANMNILADKRRAFSRLFSLFPTSCLAVPYEDWDRRQRMWKQVDFRAFFPCFVYGINGLPLTKFSVHRFATPFYGAEAFPFTEKKKEEVLTNRNLLRKEGRLEDLLRPYKSRSPVEVYESPQQQQKRPISEVIKKKYVGLYLCCNGKLIPRLHKMYKRCKRNNQAFEIVVLYIPFPSSLDPKDFQEEIEKELQEQDVRGWWCLPFNNSVSLRFWGLTWDYDCSCGALSNSWREEKLIIVEPDGKILDMYGAPVLETHGHLYPFTRNAAVERMVKEIKKLQPLKLLSGSKLHRGCDWDDDTIDADDLFRSKKKVIVFTGIAGYYVANGVDYGFDKLVTAYKDTKKRDEEFEVVFIEYHRRERFREKYVLFSDMPWYVYRHDSDGRTSYYSPLALLLRKLFCGQALVGFGEDGCIRSMKKLADLYDRRTNKREGFCLNDTLEGDMHRALLFTEYREI